MTAKRLPKSTLKDLLSDNKNLEPGAKSMTAPSQHVSRGTVKKMIMSNFAKNPIWKKPTGNEATSDSQQSSPNNETPDESKKVEVTLSQDADGKTTFKPKDLGVPTEEESQSSRISEGNNSKKASKGFQGLPSDNENLEPRIDSITSPSQHGLKGADGKRLLRSDILSEEKLRFWKKDTDNEATSDSQQSSPNNENPDESKKVEVIPSQGGDGITTFKPKDLGITTEEENQSSRISEGDSQQSSANNENPDESKTVDDEVPPSQGAAGETTSKPKDLGIPKEEENQSSSISEGKKASKGSQGLPSDNENLEPGADSITEPSQHVLKGGDGKGSLTSNFFSRARSRLRRKPSGNIEATSDSQQSSPNNENPDESKKDEVPPSQSADGKATCKPKEPKDLGNTKEEESQSSKISKRNNSEKASKGSQGLPSGNENLKPKADEIMSPSKGAGGKKSSTTSFFQNPFKKKSTGNEAISDSQQSSPNIENPDESKKVEVPPSQSADGKTTIKPKEPKDLGNNAEEESQSPKISERNNSEKASKGSSGNENLKPKADGGMPHSQDAGGKKSSMSSFLPKIENPFKKKSTGINSSNEATSDSQQSSPTNDTDGSKKIDDDDPSQGADGKTTFKPKDLGLATEEARQSWIIFEGDGPAELQEACWLDVTGSMPVIKGKTYEISFKLSMNEEQSFGWEDPVSVMAKIGEDGEYESAEVNLSQLGKDETVFPSEKFRIECKSEESTANKETVLLYFGLYEVWTNKWKGGLRIHEAIVQEVTAADSASTSNTHPEESEVPEVTADNSTSTSDNATDKSISHHTTAPPGESVVPDSASTSNEHLDEFASTTYEE